MHNYSKKKSKEKLLTEEEVKKFKEFDLGIKLILKGPYEFDSLRKEVMQWMDYRPEDVAYRLKIHAYNKGRHIGQESIERLENEINTISFDLVKLSSQTDKKSVHKKNLINSQINGLTHALNFLKNKK